jgi:hypothetical protein
MRVRCAQRGRLENFNAVALSKDFHRARRSPHAAACRTVRLREYEAYRMAATNQAGESPFSEDRGSCED